MLTTSAVGARIPHLEMIPRMTLVVLFFCFCSAPVARAQNTQSADSSSQANAAYAQGMAALQSGDVQSARAAFEKAVQFAPRSPEARNSLGWVLLAQGQIDPAIAQFQAAVNLRFDFSQAHVNLCNAFLQKGDAKSALREARDAVRFAPTDSEAYRTLARARDATGDTAGAAKDMRRAIELDPGRAELHDDLGSLLVHQSPANASFDFSCPFQ